MKMREDWKEQTIPHDLAERLKEAEKKLKPWQRVPTKRNQAIYWKLAKVTEEERKILENALFGK